MSGTESDGTGERRRRACSRGADSGALCVNALRALLHVIARPAQEALLFRTSSTKTIRRGKGAKVCQAGWDRGWGARSRGVLDAEAGSRVGAGKIKWFFARRQMLLTAAGAAVEVVGLLARDVWSVISRSRVCVCVCVRARARSLSLSPHPPSVSLARSLYYMCVSCRVMSLPGCGHTHMHTHIIIHSVTSSCIVSHHHPCLFRDAATHTCTHTHTLTPKLVYAYTLTHTHTTCNTHARTRAHTHTHAHTHTRTG